MQFSAPSDPGIGIALMRVTGRAAAPTNELGGIVKKLNALVVTLAMLSVPMAFADDLGGVVQDPNHYCDPEFIGNALLGEKLDSGLGELTQAEIDRVVATSRRTVTASNKYSSSSIGGSYRGTSATSAPAVMSKGYQVPPSNEGE
jgi:hypothetical protein